MSSSLGSEGGFGSIFWILFVKGKREERVDVSCKGVWEFIELIFIEDIC